VIPERGTPPRVRIAHLGLGGFFRAHQAWYTGAADDAGEWGIAAFTGRSRTLADALDRQHGLYTLVLRGPERDEMSVQRAVSRAHPGSDLEAWSGYLARAETAVVTLTVTEAAYARRPDGTPDLDREDVRADIAAVRQRDTVVTVPGRLVAGLAARRHADAGPLAVVSCDNVPGNGRLTADVVTALAEAADPGLAAWIHDHVAFVDTMVDRITPHTTPDDVRAVAEQIRGQGALAEQAGLVAGQVDDARRGAGRPRAAVEVDRDRGAELQPGVEHRGRGRVAGAVGARHRERAGARDQVERDLVVRHAYGDCAAGVPEVPGQVRGVAHHQRQRAWPKGVGQRLGRLWQLAHEGGQHLGVGDQHGHRHIPPAPFGRE